MDNDSSVDLSDEIKARSAAGAAAKLAGLPAAELASELMHLSPGFAQDVLDALPNDARERAISAAPADVARQWQRNAIYDRDTVGRMMEPVVAAFDPTHTVGDTIEELRELVTRALITYVYVVDDEGRLLGIVTMRDLLFSDRSRTLEEVMLRGAFALRAAMPLKDAMRLVLDRHYPVYPVVDAEQRAGRPGARPDHVRGAGDRDHRCRPAAWSASRRRSASPRPGSTASSCATRGCSSTCSPRSSPPRWSACSRTRSTGW